MTLPARKALKEMMPPTERSIPSWPDRMTRFCPAETTPSNAAMVSRLVICLGEANPGERIAPPISRTRIARRAATSGRFRNSMAPAPILLSLSAGHDDSARKRRQDDRSLDKTLPFERQLGEEDDVVDQPKDEGAENAAGDAAHAAGERR